MFFRFSLGVFLCFCFCLSTTALHRLCLLAFRCFCCHPRFVACFSCLLLGALPFSWWFRSCCLAPMALDFLCLVGVFAFARLLLPYIACGLLAFRNSSVSALVVCCFAWPFCLSLSLAACSSFSSFPCDALRFLFLPLLLPICPCLFLEPSFVAVGLLLFALCSSLLLFVRVLVPAPFC